MISHPANKFVRDSLRETVFGKLEEFNWKQIGLFLVAFFILVISSLLVANAQGTKKGSGNNSSQSSNNSQNSSQTSNSPTSNNGPSSSGITSGSSTIESTLAAYKALTANAVGISDAIKPKILNKTVVVATPADFANIVLWRSVMGQLIVLKNRATVAVEKLVALRTPAYSAAVKPPYPPQAQLPGGGGKEAAFIGSAQDVATLIQTLASIFAVNETLAPSTGTLTDAPLINLLSGELQQSGASVFIPSDYTPDLLRKPDLTDTTIASELKALETIRNKASSELERVTQSVLDAKYIAADPDKIFGKDDKDKAQQFLNPATPRIASVTSLVTAIDTFEATLFSGQPNPSPNPTANQLQPISGPAPSSNATGTTLQQIMVADLLASQIQRTNAADPELKNLRILTIHTLESGGGQLTKSNLFLGSRMSFSGGAVATFALYDANGMLECSGLTYDYNGYVREKNFEAELPKRQTPSSVIIKTNCQSGEPK